MDNQSLQKIKDALSKSNNIGVVVGREPSVDDMAAALSLYLLLKAAEKKVSVASPTDPTVELSSLVGINKVQKSLGGEAGDLVVSFPYVEGEIEKVSYTLEEGFLNIIVKASEQGLNFDEKDVNFVRGSGTVDLLFVVGTPKLSDLEDIFDQQKLRDVRIINIDNKENNQQFGDIVLVSPKFSSVSEQVADLVLALGFQLNQDVAQNLLSGITVATKNFQDPSTTSLAFEVAALLLKRGARRGGAGGAQRPDRVDRPQTQSGKSWLDELPQADDQNEPPVHQPQQSNQRQPGPRPNNDRQQNRPQQNNDSRQRQEQNRQRVQQQQQQQRQQADNQDDVKGESEDSDEEPPLDWLTPKVYKGSSDVE